jgi:hypothetical protein
LEYARRHPDDAAVLADLDAKLYGLPISVPAGILGEGEESRVSDRTAMFSKRSLCGTLRQGDHLGLRLGLAMLAQCVAASDSPPM